MYRTMRVLKGSPIGIGGLYLLVGTLWIIYSDQIVFYFFDDPGQITMIQSYKGWFYIAITGILLFLFMRKNNHVLGTSFARLQKSNDKFQVTFDAAPLGIAHHCANEQWIQVNQTMCDMLGYTKAEFQKLGFEDLIHPDDLNDGRQVDRELIVRKRKFYKMEIRFKNKEGAYLEGLMHKSIVMDPDNVPYIVVMLEDISQQKEVREELSRSVKEKEVLLGEVHHRVRNNLALISALFELQLMDTSNEIIQTLLQESLMRVKCLALVHETYARANQIAHIKFEKYIDELVQFVGNTLNSEKKHIRFISETNVVELNINQAIPAGLLCNELLVRSFGKSYDHTEEGFIKLELTQREEQVDICISDNGKEKNIQDANEENGEVRPMIIETLISQLQGSVNKISDNSRTCVRLTFQKRDYKGPSSSLQDNSWFSD